jgi:hypothetical protein
MLTVSAARRRLGEAAPVTPADYRRHVDRLLREHRITATWTSAPILGARAFANCAERHITAPPILDEDTAATALHEIGHVVAEICAGPMHYRDESVVGWWNCCTCELLAWKQAIHLCAPLPFSKAMYRKLVRSLKSYRRGTPGRAAAVRELDWLAREITFYEMRQQDVMRQIDTCRARLASAMR